MYSGGSVLGWLRWAREATRVLAGDGVERVDQYHVCACAMGDGDSCSYLVCFHWVVSQGAADLPSKSPAPCHGVAG